MNTTMAGAKGQLGRWYAKYSQIIDKIVRGIVAFLIYIAINGMTGYMKRLDSMLVAAGLAIGLETYSSPTLSNQALCKFPTIKLGPGESARSHTAGEYILLSEVERAVDVYLALLEAYENLG